MLILPKKMIHLLREFESVFSERVWEWAKVLLIGAILAPGERTVTAILRVMGQRKATAVSKLSPGAQSSQMVESSTQSHLIASVGADLCAWRCPNCCGH